MKQKDSRKLLFEMMEKVNPNFKVNEVEPQPVAQGNQTRSSDVTNMQKVTQSSSAMQYANSRIDTPQEFQDAFQTWLSTTGFNPQRKPLAISQAQSLVKNAMVKLGYK